MRPSSLIPTTLVGSLLLLTAARAPARAADIVPAAPPAAPTATFSVAEIGPDTLPRSLTADLEAAAAAGLAAAGAKVVARVPAAPGQASPNTLLRGTCQVEGSTYRFHLMLQDAQSGATLVSRDDVCEICTEKDAAETVNIGASALKTALDHTPRTLAQPAAPPARLEPRPPAAQRSSSRVPWRRVLPWVAVGAGAAAMGVGVYYLAIDGKGATYCDTVPGMCGKLNDSKAWGIEWLAIGAAVASTGLVFVFLPPRGQASEPAKGASAPPARTVGLTLLPNAVSAWGTF